MTPVGLSSQEFRQLAERVLEIAADYLDELPDRSVPPSGSGGEINAIFHRDFPEKASPDAAIATLCDTVRYSRAQNGRFFAYVLGSGEPAAATTDLLCSVLNQNVTAWRSSPAAAAIEHEVVHWLGTAIGCGGFGGILTGGGSSANLMGLAMARESKLAANQIGLRSTPPHAVYASAQAHMSITKAVSLLGIGRDQLRLIPVDASFRMIPRELENALRRDQSHGILPIAVVATAGTVNTGAVDPLPSIAELAASYGAWLHVDGSYGALAAIATPETFPGLSLADSLALDPHKWLYQPLDCGCLLHRHTDAAHSAFAQSGDYVRALSADPIESFEFFEESIELSRRFRALKLWFSLLYYGFESFRDSIRKDLQHARRLREILERTPGLELMAPVELSAVCFRYTGEKPLPDADVNQLNRRILQTVNQRGRVYLSNAMLHAKFCLRACVVNHRTTDSDIDAIVPEILSSARELQSGD